MTKLVNKKKQNFRYYCNILWIKVFVILTIFFTSCYDSIEEKNDLQSPIPVAKSEFECDVIQNIYGELFSWDIDFIKEDRLIEHIKCLDKYKIDSTIIGFYQKSTIAFGQINKLHHFRISQLSIKNSWVIRKFELYKRNESTPIRDTVLIKTDILSNFADIYNQQFETQYDHHDFTDNFLLDKRRRLSFFGGVGGNVFSRKIFDVIEKQNTNEIKSLLKSLNSSDKLLAVIVIEYMLSIESSLSNDIMSQYDRIINSRISTKVSMACTHQNFNISNYPNSLYDSLITKFVTYGTDSIEFRLVDNY